MKCLFIGRPSYSKMSFPCDSFSVFGRGCTILFLKCIVRDSEGTEMLLHLVLLLMPFNVLWHLSFCHDGCPQTLSRPTKLSHVSQVYPEHFSRSRGGKLHCFKVSFMQSLYRFFGRPFFLVPLTSFP